MTANDKLLLYLNDALAVENAAIPRLEQRIKESRLEDARAQLRHHLEETREQQRRLSQLIGELRGKPTREMAKLPIPQSPKSLSARLSRSMTEAEMQLKRAKEDSVIENAEIVMYDTLSQVAQQMGIGAALPVLNQNLNEEKEMADWLRANTPVMITQLFPEVESSVIEVEEGGGGRQQEQQESQDTRVSAGA